MYLAVILAAIIITKVLNSEILYYRYLFVITGLYIFAISYILAKSENKYLITIVCIVVLSLGIYNNIIQIKDNYAVENKGMGIMCWAYTEDTADSYINSIYDIMHEEK